MAAKKAQKVYKLADVIRDVQESKHKIVIETDDGEKFEIDPPELWDDEIFTVVGGPVAEAKAIMGHDEYERFRKSGGRATLLQHIIGKHTGSVTLGE